MYPNLSALLKELFNIDIPLPIQTYGFFVAIAFIIATYVLKQELKRKENRGQLKSFEQKEISGEPAKKSEIIISAVVGFLVGFKLVEAVFNYSDFVDNPQTFILSARGSWWGAIIFAGLSALWTYYEKKKKEKKPPIEITKIVHPYELSGNMLIITAVFGLIGTKIFHNLENIDDLLRDPVQAILSFSGLSFFGGLIVGGIALIIYGKRNGIKPLHMADASAFAVSIGYAIGRIGCQMAGDGCWGIANTNPKPDWLSFLPDWMWSFKFPHNVINEGVRMSDCMGKYCYVLDAPVYPTSFYETCMMLLVFGILWILRHKLTTPGMLFSLYLILQGIERFFIEKIRINNVYHIFNYEVTQAEIISVFLFFGGIAALILINKNKEKLSKY